MAMGKQTPMTWGGDVAKMDKITGSKISLKKAGLKKRIKYYMAYFGIINYYYKLAKMFRW